MALTVIDRAIQSFGAEGVSQDQELAMRWAHLRTLRIADVSVFLSARYRFVDDGLGP
jgi:alkylation response protein AidB-like acyl-CoA dehydrogenase